MSIILMRGGILKANGGGGGGGGGATQIFVPRISGPTDAPLNANDANPNTAFRIGAVLAANAATQIRVTFTAGTDAGLVVTNASIGKGAGTGFGDCTATPLTLLFSGASGFTISAGAQITSDWLNLSGLTMVSGDTCMVSYSSGGTGGMRYRNTLINATTWYSGNTALWNTQTWGTDPGTVTNTCYVIEKIETQ